MGSVTNSRNSISKIIALIILAAGMGIALPLAAGGDTFMVPINVQVKAAFPISSDLQSRLITVTKDLIRNNFSEILAKSSSSNAETTILEKTSKGYIVEVRVVSLFKATFTAQMSRIEFAYEDDQVRLRAVEPSFQPKWEGR
ncbi:MAG TPA: hypothetical protein DDY17_02525 [Syntrophaceae bacterium]|jgi:hypothetical protein|nr:hypothetical protein [Syntrophaceae bacterium]